MKFPKEYAMFEEYSPFYGKQFFIHTFNEYPSCHETEKLYDSAIVEWLKTQGFDMIAQYKIDGKEGIPMTSTFLNRTDKILLRVSAGKARPMMLRFRGSKTPKEQELVSLCFYYDCTTGKRLEHLINWKEADEFKKTEKRSISLVVSEDGMLVTREYDLVIPEMDLALNYGDDFVPIHEKIVERLNAPNDKGIILLHGDPGTGKTSYIKYLTSQVKEKEMLFIPPSMAESLANPDIIPFLMSHKDAILVVEDAENVVSDRKIHGSSSAGVSTILNMTDGILGDCLNIQVIATFNMERARIDEALLRKGRLIAEHKFGKLEVDHVNKLLTTLGKPASAEEKMVLADIYNIEEEGIRSESPQLIGFRK